MRRARLLACALALLGLAFVRAAFAHSFAPAVLDVREQAAGVFDVAWKMPGAESGVLTPGDELVTPQFPEKCRRSDIDTSAEGPAFWRLDCGPDGLRGAPLFVSGLDGSRVEVIVRISWRDGTAASAILRSGADTFAIPVASTVILNGAPASAVLWSYGRVGVERMLFGFDHLMFVLGLLLLVDSWVLLLKTIGAFALAHSLALALTALGVVAVPTAPVEALIALSVVLVALELTRAPDAPATLTKRYPWAVALAFGLLHGLGFASALTEVGLPSNQVPLALLSFNLGVELGQVLFVAVMMGPLLLFRRSTGSLSRLRLLPAYAIGALAVASTIERVQRFWT